MSVLDTLRAATPTRKTVTMCLDGALQAEWEQANEALDAAVEADVKHASMEGTYPALNAAVDHLDSLRDKVKASEVTFLFGADGLSWNEYLQLQAEHEPREDNPLDRFRGYNVETFLPALVRRTCVSVIGHDGEPQAVPGDVWDSLLGVEGKGGSLNLKQVNNLADAAFYVMNGENRVPPSARSLLESQDFGASLAQPSPGQDPAPSDFEAGSQPGSPSTSTKKKARTKADSNAP